MRNWARTIGIGASLALILSSMAMNGIYLFGLGRTGLEATVLAAVSISADALKAVLPLMVVALWRRRQRIRAVGATGLQLVLLALSITAALGYALENRDQVLGSRDARAAVRDAKGRDVARLEADLAKVTYSRAAGVVEEEQRWMQAEGLFLRTKNCTATTGPAGRDWCAAYRKVTAELAAAKEKERLENQLQSARLETAALAAKGAEPGGALFEQLLHRMTGIAEQSIHDGWLVGFVLMVELGAAFGLVFTAADDITTVVTTAVRKPRFDWSWLDRPYEMMRGIRRNIRPASYRAGAKGGGVPAPEALKQGTGAAPNGPTTGGSASELSSVAEIKPEPVGPNGAEANSPVRGMRRSAARSQG